MYITLEMLRSQIATVKYDIKRYTNRLNKATTLVKPNSTRMADGRTIEEYNKNRRSQDCILLPNHICMLKLRLEKLLAEKEKLQQINKKPVMVQLMFDL